MLGEWGRVGGAPAWQSGEPPGARSTHVTGGVLTMPPWGALGSVPCPRLYPALLPHLVSFQLPTHEPSSSRSELSSTPFQGGAPPTRVCSALWLCTCVSVVAALYSHVCAQDTCVYPLTASPILSQSSLAASGTRCRRVGLFFPCVLGSEKKKNPQMSCPGALFPSFFSAQVSLKGTSLSVSNSFALNSSRSFVRAV